VAAATPWLESASAGEAGITEEPEVTFTEVHNYLTKT
jgi:hypothetical protein